MKKIKCLSAALFLLLNMALWGQFNGGFDYRGQLTNGNSPLANQNITVRFRIQQGSSTVYTETHSTTTDARGVFHVVLGEGTTTDDFNALEWNAPMSVEVDIDSGSGFVGYDTFDFEYVPHAKFALKAGNVPQRIDDFDDGKTDTNETSLYIGSGAGVSDDDSDNENTGVGQECLTNNTSGEGNTAVGYQAMHDNTTGSFNTAIGSQALYKNQDRNGHTAVGYKALYNNGTGASGPGEAMFNTAVGYHALTANTTGSYNTAVGGMALQSNTTGSYNTASGFAALAANTTGSNNTAAGSYAMQANTTGSSNTAVGASAMQANTSGSNNTAAGMEALKSNQTGNNNTALGRYALTKNTSSNNTALGIGSLGQNTTGDENTAIGMNVFSSNKTGQNNTAMGYYAGSVNRDGSDNIYFGSEVANKDTTGTGNIGIGSGAFYNSSVNLHDGENNAIAIGYKAMSQEQNQNSIAIGTVALRQETSGQYNIAIGTHAADSIVSGANNISIGYGSMSRHLDDGDENIAIGVEALRNPDNNFNNIAVGYNAMKDNADGSNFNTFVGASMAGWMPGAGQAMRNVMLGWETPGYDNLVFVGEMSAIYTVSDNYVIFDNEQLWNGGQVNWSTYSDGRFKTDVKEDIPGLDFILRLRPVTYEMDMQKTDAKEVEENEMKKKTRRQTGFIAQEVAQAAKEIGYDFSGVRIPDNPDGTYTLSYAQFVVPLVKAVQEQQEIIQRNQNLIEEQTLDAKQRQERIKQLQDANQRLETLLNKLRVQLQQWENARVPDNQVEIQNQ